MSTGPTASVRGATGVAPAARPDTPIAAPAGSVTIEIAPCPTSYGPAKSGLPQDARHSSWTFLVASISDDVGFSRIASRVDATQSPQRCSACAIAPRKRHGPGSLGSAVFAA